MKYQAILFDLDGTLLDTIDDIGDAANRILLNRGFPTHSIPTYRRYIGRGAKVLLTRALPRANRDQSLINACLKEFIEDYSCNYNVKSKPYHGIPELLDALKSTDLKLAILSNKPDPITKDCAASLLSKWHFDMVMGQRDSVPRKPDPRGAFAVAEKLGIPPADFLYVGDTAVDMQTAVSAGMYPVGVLWGFRPEELKESGALALIEKPVQLLNLIVRQGV